MSLSQRFTGEADEPSTVELTHYGRKSGQPYTTKVWFVNLDGYYWIGSLDPDGSWVRNVRASGHAHLDFGNGRKEYKCYWIVNSRELRRFANAIKQKHPVMSRLIRLLRRRRKQIAFRLEPVV